MQRPDAQHCFRVVIVGGGISGLGTAFYLERSAQAVDLPLHVVVIDQDTRLGGKLLTERVGDRGEFVVEGGPDSFLTQKPWGLELVRDLGMHDQLLSINKPKHAVYALHRGRPCPMPEGLMLVVPTQLAPFLRTPLLSRWGKLRMALDFVIPARRSDTDESLADFIRRRLGQEMLDVIAEPLMAGIYNAEAERQSLLATFPRFREIERQYGSLIRGMVAQRRVARKQKPSAHTGPFVTLRGGVGTLIDRLAALLQGQLFIGRRVVAIERPPLSSALYEVRLDTGTLLPADAVVLATPAFAAADVVASHVPDLAQALKQIRYVTTGTVSLAFRRNDIGSLFDGFGLIIPTREGRRINACTITSAKFQHRSPDDNVLLRVFFGGSRHPDIPALDDAALLALIRQELRQIFGICAEPLFTRVYRWEYGTPQYDIGHLDRVAQIEALCPAGLYLTGSAYRGVGIPDCVKQAQTTASAVIAYGQRQFAKGFRVMP